MFAMLLAGFAADAVVAGRAYAVAEGWALRPAAVPGLVERPVHASFDARGRLYVTDVTGTNDKPAEQNQRAPHRVLRLEDTDGDGVFDQRTVFAEKLGFPEGILWHRGHVYVAAPPVIWKFTDADGDGISEKREVWHDGGTLTGCANDLHGPYVAPDGWLYWTKGAWQEQKFQGPRGKEVRSKASHVFRRKPEGGPVEAVMAGGMDNPIGLAFTPGNEIFLSNTFLVHPGNGQRDGLIHVLYGGLYGKPHAPIDDQVRTGDLLPAMTHLGPAAPSGICWTRDGGSDGSILCTQFNMRKLSQHRLIPVGATFRTEDSDVLSSTDFDFHPTDVLPTPKGGVLVVDTGGWYKLCCPTSQIAKPAVLGGLLLLERQRPLPAPSPQCLAEEAELLKIHRAGLNRDRNAGTLLRTAFAEESPHFRRAAVVAMGRVGGPDVAEELAKALPASSGDRALSHALAYALWELGADDAARAAARSEHPRARQAGLLALEQWPGRKVPREQAFEALASGDAELRQAALWIVQRHPEWSADLAAWTAERLKSAPSAAVAALVPRLAGQPPVRAALAQLAGSSRESDQAAALRMMAAAPGKEIPRAWFPAVRAALASAHADAALEILRQRPHADDALAASQALRSLAGDPAQPLPRRLRALAALPGAPALTDAELALLLAALKGDQPTEHRSAAAEAVERAKLAPPQWLALAEALKGCGPLDVARIAAKFGQTKDAAVGKAFAAAVVNAQARKALPRAELAKLLAGFGPALAAEAKAAMAARDADDAGQREALDKLLAKLPAGNAERGLAVFRSSKAACLACHKLAYVGGELGPDLTRIGAIRTQRDLAEAVVQPSASFVRSYEPTQFELADGRRFNGMVRRRLGGEVVLAVGANQEIRFAEKEVAEEHPGTVSVMPAGLEKQLSPGELADLLAFLAERK